ncbi:MAG: hypothetical protein Q9169_002572 [Polycauliona sp. 2 TL-2023]
MTFPDRVCLMIFFHRKTGMSFEDFDTYWRETHAKVACELPIFKKNILKYEQIHIDHSSAQSWRDDGHKVTDYDGIVVLEAECEEDIRAVFRDEEYLAKLAPNEAEFSERSSFVMMPARMVTVMDKTKQM